MQPYRKSFGSLGQPMSTSCGSGIMESKLLFGPGGRPTARPTALERRQQFCVTGLENRSPDSVRAYSTETSTYGSGRPYDEYPPTWLAGSSRPTLLKPSTSSSHSGPHRPPSLGNSASFGQLSRPFLSTSMSTLSPTGRHKVRPNLGDSIFEDWPMPPPPPPGDDSRAVFKRYRNAQMGQARCGPTLAYGPLPFPIGPGCPRRSMPSSAASSEAKTAAPATVTMRVNLYSLKTQKPPHLFQTVTLISCRWLIQPPTRFLMQRRSTP